MEHVEIAAPERECPSGALVDVEATFADHLRGAGVDLADVREGGVVVGGLAVEREEPTVAGPGELRRIDRREEVTDGVELERSRDTGRMPRFYEEA